MSQPDGRTHPPPPENYQPEVYEMDPSTMTLKRLDKYIPPLSPNGSRDFLAGMPWWVRAVIMIGPIGVLALGLAYQNAFVTNQGVVQNGRIISEVRQEAIAHDRRVTDQFNALTVHTVETNRILMAGCVNNAKDEDARDRCSGKR